MNDSIITLGENETQNERRGEKGLFVFLFFFRFLSLSNLSQLRSNFRSNFFFQSINAVTTPIALEPSVYREKQKKN